LRALIEKQGLRVKDGFFSKSFFLYTIRKNLLWGTKYVYRRTFSFIFFSTCHGKDILELKQAMFKLATSFHMKSRGPSGWRKKMKHKKMEALNEKKKFVARICSILDTFKNTKGWKYSINSICWEKATISIILGRKTFYGKLCFCILPRPSFFFVKLVLLRSNNGYFVFRRGDEWLKMVKLLHLDCNRNSRKS